MDCPWKVSSADMAFAPNVEQVVHRCAAPLAHDVVADLPSLRSVKASTRPLYGRGAGSTPAGGSCCTPVAQWRERCSATAEAAGSTPAGRTPARNPARLARYDDSSGSRPPDGRSGRDGRNPPRRRMKARVASPCWLRRLPRAGLRFLKVRGVTAHGELQPRRSGFESWRTCFRRGPERLGYLSVRAASGPCGSTPRTRPHTMTATMVLMRAETGPVIDTYIDRSRVRIPPGACGLR
jgi:hypothetical protein